MSNKGCCESKLKIRQQIIRKDDDDLSNLKKED